MKTTIVSAAALMLMLGVPAHAQTSVAPQSGAAIGAQQGQSVDRDQIQKRLGEAGVEDRNEFKGRLVRAQSPEGHSVLMIVGPENMEGDKSMDAFNQDKIRGQLTTAGFRNIAFVDDATMVRGSMDDKAVLALTGRSGWSGGDGRAQSDTPNTGRFVQALGQIGFEDRSELKGKLVQARLSGQSMFILLGPEDFSGDGSVEFSATELSNFQQNGFQDVRIVEDIELVRGTLDDMTVIAISGQGLSASPSTTGSVR